MNCHCGNPAAYNIVKQSNSPNFGKGFFACDSRSCKFFQFVDEPQSNVAFSRFHPPQQTVSTLSSSMNLKRGLKVKIFLDSFDEVEFKFWCGVLPSDPSIEAMIHMLGDGLCRYSGSLKLWLINFTAYDAFVASIHNSPHQYDLEEIPKFLVKGISNFLKHVNKYNSEPVLDILDSMRDKLLPFQLDGVKFVVRRNGRALIGDEMGCGKTIQALAIIYHYRAHWPAIILCPPNLLEQWEREINSNLSDVVRACDLKLIRKGSDVLSGKICLVSYTALDGLMDRDRNCPMRFGVVVADESHLLKNKDAKRTSNALPFLRRAQVAICLSGTPATNRPVELYTQLNGLLPSVFNDFDQFTRRYCDSKPSRFGGAVDVRGSSNEKELKLLLNSLVMIRRLKDDVIKLPSKDREVIYIEADALYLYELKNCKDNLKSIENAQSDGRNDPGVLKQLRQEQQSLLTSYYSITGLAKVSSVKRELKRILDDIRKCYLNKCVSVDTKLSLDGLNEYNSLGSEYVIHVDSEDLFDDAVIYVGGTKRGMALSKKKKDDLHVAKKQKNIHNSPELVDDKALGLSFDGSISSSDVWKSILTGKSTVNTGIKSVRGSKSETVNPTIAPCDTVAGEKVLIFCHHKCVMDAVEDFIRENLIGYIRIDGDVTVSLRDNLIHTFQTDEKTEIAILSISACSTGLNLTRASVVLFAELSWSPGQILQAEDRVHRIGQNADKVKIIYLVAKDTADDIVWGQIQRKHEVIGATVGIAENGNYSRLNNPQKILQQPISNFFRGPTSKVFENYSAIASSGTIVEAPVVLCSNHLGTSNKERKAPLSPSTKRRIEENRQRAIQKLRESKTYQNCDSITQLSTISNETEIDVSTTFSLTTQNNALIDTRITFSCNNNSTFESLKPITETSSKSIISAVSSNDRSKFKRTID